MKFSSSNTLLILSIQAFKAFGSEYIFPSPRCGQGYSSFVTQAGAYHRISFLSAASNPALFLKPSLLLCEFPDLYSYLSPKAEGSIKIHALSCSNTDWIVYSDLPLPSLLSFQNFWLKGFWRSWTFEWQLTSLNYVSATNLLSWTRSLYFVLLASMFASPLSLRCMIN